MSSARNGKLIARNSLPVLAEEDVRSALEKILASRTFAHSDRIARFLRYIVEETLAGRSDRLKEYPIAIEAFERDENFDPQMSSLVRVEAGRLRTKLDEYYRGDGADDPFCIDLPRGGYVPTFARQHAQVDTSAVSDLKIAASSGFFTPTLPRRHIAIASVILLAGLAGALTWLVGAKKPNGERRQPGKLASVAVLPLRNLTGDTGQDYLSDGVTDAIISRLAKSPRFRVASMTSVMHFKNRSASISEIGSKLGVTHLVEGTVKRSGNRVLISAKLIDVGSNRHLWVASFKRPLTEILALQDEVAQKVGQSLAQRHNSQEPAARERVPSVRPDAYEAYLRGRFFRNKSSASGFYKAISYFKHSISIAPDFAPARAGLAGCYCLLGGHGLELVRPEKGMPQAKDAARAALRIDDRLAEPYAYLGMISFKYDWDWKTAERDLKHSIELKPNLYIARLFYSLFLEAMGRQNEALRQAELARALNPLSLQAQVNLGWQYLQSGTLERARGQFESALELETEFWGAHWALGHYYRRQGLFKQSIASFERSVQSGGGHALPLSALGHAYAISGRAEDARKILEKLKVIERGGYVSPFNFATIYVGLGDDGNAMMQLERAYKDRSRSLAWLNVMPEYDRLRQSPKFKALIRKIGLPRHGN